MSRFCRFSLVGILGAALQLLLLWLFVKRLHLSALAATPLAVELVILHNFAWHERFTWIDLEATLKATTMTRLWRFQAGNGMISLLGNTVLTYLFVSRLHAQPLASAIASIALCSLLNFGVADRWVYIRTTSRDLIGS